MNTPGISIGAHPQLINNKPNVASRLAPVLAQSASLIRTSLAKGKPFVWLNRGLPRTYAQKITELGIPGIQILSDDIRSYPNSHLASHVLGFTDVDGRGISGIEFAFDQVLSGKKGEAVFQLTANGKSFERIDYPVVEPKDGCHVVLTIDQVYQSIVEEELRKTIANTHAIGGSIVVTNPYSGEVLAMATEPSFEPNHAGLYHPNTWRLRPVTDQMEPGSTFKIAMMAAILNEGLRKPQDIVFCENGKFDILGETIHDVKEHGWLTLHDVVVYSSNIGMAKTAMDVPPSVLYKYAREFGFGMRTGIDLPGEVDGKLDLPVNWYEITPATLGFGHGIAVTQIQMVAMYGAIANGGLLMKPMIIKEILDESGETLSTYEPVIIRRVVSQATTEAVTAMMEDVVRKGTGKQAAIEGVRICGKTGTARKPKPNGDGYFKNQHLSSFGGFFPADGDDKLCVFIVIDTPKNKIYGGDVAAPCFKAIAKRIIELEGLEKFVSPKDSVKTNKVWVPSFVGRDLDTVRQLLSELGLRMKTVGEGNLISNQEPEPGVGLERGSEVVLQLSTPPSEKSAERIMPNVVGLNIREALNQLSLCNVTAVVNGHGKVVNQQPAHGTVLEPGEQCLLECESSIDLAKLFAL